MSLAFVCPGQGNQSVGMGKSLADTFPVARHLFEEVDEALEAKLSRLIWEGPEETLALTENAQPALMAVSLAVSVVLAKEFNIETARATLLAGHSLGEYSALAAAGSFSVSEAARLLRLRGRAMQEAVAPGEGAMAALIGKVDLPAAEEIAAEGAKTAICVVANDNNVGNIVISGASEGVAAANAAAKARGIRSIALNVSAPFHSPLMEPAARAMEAALGSMQIAPPARPIVSNVTASAVSGPAEIRRLLVKQVCGRVRWRESVLHMRELGIETFVEIGAGKSLAGMVKRTVEDARTYSLLEPRDLEAFANEFAR